MFNASVVILFECQIKIDKEFTLSFISVICVETNFGIIKIKENANLSKLRFLIITCHFEKTHYSEKYENTLVRIFESTISPVISLTSET